MHFRKGVLFILLIIVAMVVAACGNKDDENGGTVAPPDIPTLEDVQFPEIDRTGIEDDKVIATYEGGQITGADLARYLGIQGFLEPNYPVNDPMAREGAIEILVFQKLINELVDGESLQTAKERVDEMWQFVIAQYDEQTQAAGYSQLNVSEEDVKSFFTSIISAQVYFEKQVTDAEIQEFYEEITEQITTADVRHILIGTSLNQPDGTVQNLRTEQEAKDLADQLYNRLQQGEDFAALAQEYSDDKGSKENGGLYADAPVYMWVPEFKAAALDQKINVIGQPVKTEFGYHIIRVEKREVLDLEEIREPLIANLVDEKMIEYLDTEVIDKIIEVNL
jgi:parvulin-like peptidyl-prolyl isomerase